MGNFKKFMAMAAVSCMALTTMTACGNSGDAGSGDGDTNEIKIGLNYELSGETANYGTPEYNAPCWPSNRQMQTRTTSSAIRQ